MRKLKKPVVTCKPSFTVFSGETINSVFVQELVGGSFVLKQGNDTIFLSLAMFERFVAEAGATWGIL